MKHLPILDLCVIGLYMAAMVCIGLWFSRRVRTAEQFSKTSGKVPAWAIGISIYATFLSSNTFLGVPGKAFGGNWSAFVFSLSMPLAAWVAAKYFIPFYRSTKEVSAYTHLEKRFGAWARSYTVVCFLLTQLARIGSIFFGIALSLQALTGYSMIMIMVVMGVIIIVYTVLGGMESVIWTEVLQGIIKTLGALLILFLILVKMPGGFNQVISIGQHDGKFSLGGFLPDFKQATFWVVLLYGFFINLNNFGMDQNYIQRYHASASNRQAASSVWLCVKLYMPASLLFFVIGSALYAYYQVTPALIEPVKLQAAAERLGANASASSVAQLAATLRPQDYGDKVMPAFMAANVPVGLVGLIVSAILSAAMSTISSGINASATVFIEDIYKRYINKNADDSKTLFLLYIGTIVFGIAGLVIGIEMIGVKSILDTWWQLSGIFAAGMLGLFLLGIISRQTRNAEALTAVVVGILVILWMSIPSIIPEKYSSLRYTLNGDMIIVIGTLTIFLTGIIITKIRRLATNN